MPAFTVEDIVRGTRGALLSGDLGTSIFTNQPVASELFSALLNTFKIALPAVVLGRFQHMAGDALALGDHGLFRLADDDAGEPHRTAGIAACRTGCVERGTEESPGYR